MPNRLASLDVSLLDYAAQDERCWLDFGGLPEGISALQLSLETVGSSSVCFDFMHIDQL